MPGILVIDDEPEVREALRRVLVRAGFPVATAGSAAEALVALRDRTARGDAVEVVIIDIVMPDTDGASAIQSMRAEFPGVRVIAISGGGNFGINGYRPNAITTESYLALASKVGADAVLAKPFETAELLAKLAQVTKAHGARGARQDAPPKR